MGYGSYRASDWAKLKNSRGISNSSSAGDIFADEFKDVYDPRFIEKRESRDSDDSPESTPIILGFDVTGSMGFLAAEIAKNSLNKTITEIYDKQPVTNPHVMCAAFTEPFRVPKAGALQVTQFEADIRVVEQLLDLKVRFGGNTYSYDDLVWYFASRHTEIDCYNKRGKKGFIFCIGDEVCGFQNGDRLSAAEIRATFNDEIPVDQHIALKELYDETSRKYEIFHIVTHMKYRDGKPFSSWDEFMKGRVALIKDKDIEYLSEVVISIMQLVAGKDRDSILSQWDDRVRPIVRDAIRSISV